ncbi:MAG: hypothetical protein A2X67_07355 [Ignavibacteria bacterium GWA2_55_11]|nr:MAG: hypothetical protein A2X67_07355 [Ignavibacteria bacterium GWA2_55_11]OGU43652.1 MAG: hypothetical protein A2X68_06470 [Ignavibacteria bacterium GWC2_56_12]OGU63864.1 MAG: hypothetical protein A3C56_06020 [Ignavibacteria bacterium RIFCSPHIGHO2_02_FULL_56_12]OGU69040.1 MAG: hypothetical protein A3H45_04020 [Ignavibacteria bacterium RIFCSPLOWO2_02_FULL_55_14]OGU76420.1 MAG: hypothetical protein A3G43_00240 [Ignavibacteria bacterium RIFCSPLOWO2_12_FULL_56_21]HAV23991.1 hypothetical protei
MYYYRIYDDKEQLNFFKSSLDRKTIDAFKLEFERDHRSCCNPDFLKFLKTRDQEVETFTISDISY